MVSHGGTHHLLPVTVQQNFTGGDMSSCNCLLVIPVDTLSSTERFCYSRLIKQGVNLGLFFI